MSDREKVLGGLVAGLLALFVLFGVYRMVDAGIQSKQDKLKDRVSKLKAEKARNLTAKKAAMTVREYQRRSLNGNIQTGHREFQHWLEKQIKLAGLSKHHINFDSMPRSKKSVMKELSYSVTGHGDINQITEFLHSLHAAETLHRVRSLDLQKQKDSKALKLTLRIDALSMPEIDKLDKVAVGTVSDSKVKLTAADYKDIISKRNLFSPANLAPEFESLRTQDVEVGTRLSYQLEATDPDEDEVFFELDEDAPEWLDISESGRLTGRPKDLGEHTFKVYVVDRGIPSKEDVGELSIRVIPQRVAEEVEEPEFDEAKLAVLTAIVQGGRDPMPQMCVYLRSKDESQYLQQGDKIEVGEWIGKVVSVDPGRNVVRVEHDERQFVLKLGDALTDARPVEDETL